VSSRRIILPAALLLALSIGASQSPFFPVLLNAVLAGKQSQGFTLVVTNQIIRPWGEQVLLAGRPVDIALDPSGQHLAILNSRGVEFLDPATGSRLAAAASRSTSYTGLAYRPGAREVWASEATRNGPDSLLIVPLKENGLPGESTRIALAGHPVPAGIAFTPDGTTAFVAFTASNTVAVIDAASRKILRETPAGMVPFSIVYAAKSKRLFVTNRGGRRPAEGGAFSYSSTSRVGSDGETGATVSGTVSVIDTRDWSEKQVETGLAPSGIALSKDEDTLAVANAHSDSVSIVDTKSLAVSAVKIPAFPEGTFGSQPIAPVFSRSGKQLFVACGGINAVAVLERDGRGWRFAGALPVGWFPTALAIDRNDNLRVVSVKGTGNTANAKGLHNSRNFEGSLVTIPPAAAARAEAGLREVRAASAPQFEPLNGEVSDLSTLGVEHVVLIIKENRTYDQVLSDIPRGRRDPRLLMYGRDVTPNHHALAEQYVLLDNFYTSGAISFDGHHWLMQAFVSDYVERAFAASPRGYAWNLADALTVSPAGFFWQGAPRPLDVRLYGAASEPATFDPATQRVTDINEHDLLPWPVYWEKFKHRQWQPVVGSRPGVLALRPVTEQRFPASTMNIPDAIRAEAWLDEMARREKSGRFPNLSVITLTADHTMGTRPQFPTPRAMVADNDLALGRIVESISKSRFWPRTLILVTEDDAQDGIDHVSGYRTIGLAIGPHVRRGVLDSTHYNHTSMIRTIQEIFRIPPRTRALASARAMATTFQREAKPETYTAVTPAIPLDEMNPPLKALSGPALRAARQSLTFNSHEVDDVPHDVMNRILWGAAKGWSTPYPDLRRR
jgi:YVTN family beta-propeller protein